MLLAATGDDRLDPSLANLLALFVMVVAAISVERIDAGRVDKHAEAPGRAGDLGREPVYRELLHVRTPTPTSTTRPRIQAGKAH